MSQRVDQIFAERLAWWGDRTAIKMGSRLISYTELDRISNRLARRLIEDDVRKGDIVAVATGDVSCFAIAVLAILKVGAVYLAIDTRYPVERVRDILMDSAPAILLIDAEFPDRLIPPGLPVIDNFAANTALCRFSDRPVEVLGNADDVACVFYTSGSTGRSKGIEVYHRGIPNLVGDRDFVAFGPDDRVGQASNFAFDAISFEVWGALLNGGSIVHIPKDVLFSAPALAHFLQREGITIVWITTSLFNALASSLPTAFGMLRTLVIGGEAADPLSIGRVLRSDKPPRRLVNAYGPTEVTTFATWHEVTLADIDAGRVPIGRPIRNTKTYVLDEHMTTVGNGEPGELFVGGPGVAKGYLHQPEQTNERFIPDPFDPTSAGRLYRTGDLCRELPNGDIEYIGRIDDQVKIRGFRVEPSEVGATLRRLSGVEDAVVLTRKASFGTGELIAFVRGGALPPTEQLRQEMAGLVPDYMVPSIFQPVLEFPLTANGKLDRTALLAKIQSGGRADTIGEPVDEIEKRVAAIWRCVLQRDNIALDEDFHAIGGDSLSTMNLALEIERAFGVVFSVDDLASPLTVLQLAAELRARLDDMRAAENETPAKVFAISYPWVMGRMPAEIGSALSPDGWRHVQVPFTYFRTDEIVTIESMAAELEKLIYSTSPRGPYVLYGHCITGMLAYEVAQRLVAAGHTVSMVVIVDSYPTVQRSWLKRAESTIRRAARFASLDSKLQLAKLHGKLRPARSVDYKDFIRELCVKASYRYRPRPYHGRVVFFRDHCGHAMVGQDPTAWRRLVRGPYVEYFVDFHNAGKVTAESRKSGFSEVAARLAEMKRHVTLSSS